MNASALRKAKVSDLGNLAYLDADPASTTHIARTDNPHAVTAAQVGLGSVLNTPQMQHTQITNAGFGVCSNGTLESAVSSVDLLGGTGEFEVVGDVALWTALNGATLARDTGTVQNGAGSLKITNNGATAGGATRAFTTVIGRVYKLAAYCNIGTSVSSQIRAGTTSGGFELGYNSTTASGFVRLELIFEAVGTTTYISAQTGNAVNGGVHYYDSITLYDMGANLVTNGTFNANTTGWVPQNTASVSMVGSGINGNCAQASITAGNGVVHTLSGLTVGKLYRVCGWLKNGGVTGPALFVGSTAGASDRTALNPGYATLPSWTFYYALFEAQESTVYITMYAGSVGTVLFDSITLTEVTVGCVDYNAKALDLWHKDNSACCWRETIDTKEGSYYALRVYNGAVYWSDGQRSAKPEFYRKYAGRQAVVGCWVKSTTASARIGIQDSAGTTWDTHSGGGAWEWLEVTKTPTSGVTSYQIVLDSGTATEARFTQLQLQFGPVIGEGNFVPMVGEWIGLETEVISSTINGARSVTAITALTVCVDSAGKLPRGLKSVDTHFYGYDSSAAFYSLAIYNGQGQYLGMAISPGAGIGGHANVCVPLDVAGMFKFSNTATGTNTFTASLRYKGVQL